MRCSECPYGSSYSPLSDFCDGCVRYEPTGWGGGDPDGENGAQVRIRRAFAGLDIWGGDGEDSPESDFSL